MVQVKCAVIDDSMYDLETIKCFFDGISGEETISFIVDYVNSPLLLNLSLAYDLYILDIDMPEKSGFELANEVYACYPDAHIVFFTNHEHLVFDTFKLNAFYFVRKPELNKDLRDALQKYIKNLMISRLFYSYKGANGAIDIPYGKILYFEVLKNDLYVNTVNGVYQERKSMIVLLQEIEEGLFIPASRNYLVNPHFISEIINRNVILTDGQKIELPRRRVREVMDMYARFLLAGI